MFCPCGPRVFCPSGIPSFLARRRVRGPAGTGSVGDSVGEGAHEKLAAPRALSCPTGSPGCHDLCKTEPALPSGVRFRALTADLPETASATGHDARRVSRDQTIQTWHDEHTPPLCVAAGMDSWWCRGCCSPHVCLCAEGLPARRHQASPAGCAENLAGSPHARALSTRLSARPVCGEAEIFEALLV